MEFKEKCKVYFSLVKDTRNRAYITYELDEILFIIMCGIICGCTSLEEIVEIMENKIEVLQKYMKIETIPSESTLSRILSAINPDELELCIVGIMKNILNRNVSIDTKHIAIDGKAIKSTSSMKSYKNNLQIVTALLVDEEISMGQVCIHDKSNEITAVRELLEILDLNNVVITMDAMHCQKETINKIVERKGDYIIQLKGNQGNFYEDVRLMFEDKIADKRSEENYLTYTQIEKNGGRIETRTAYILKDFEYFEKYKKDWKNLKTIICIKRTREMNGQKSEEKSYYLSSKLGSAKELMNYTRKHWQIESYHWILDMNYGEDNCKIYNEKAQKNLNLLRKISIKMHKNYIEKTNPKRKTISSSIRNCLTNNTKLIDFLESF